MHLYFLWALMAWMPYVGAPESSPPKFYLPPLARTSELLLRRGFFLEYIILGKGEGGKGERGKEEPPQFAHQTMQCRRSHYSGREYACSVYFLVPFKNPYVFKWKNLYKTVKTTVVEVLGYRAWTTRPYWGEREGKGGKGTM